MSFGNGTTTIEPFISTTLSPEAIETANKVNLFLFVYIFHMMFPLNQRFFFSRMLKIA